jgi:23S rRNA (pseudouridine1915-N3)-methyltransferase
MFKIKVFTIGKCKEQWLEEALAEYSKRLQGQMSIEWVLLKDLKQLKSSLHKEPSYIALDPQGSLFSSEEFAIFLQKALMQEGSRLSFAIGGAEGLPSDLLERAFARVSLSPLTFTHQLTRLILVEQMYRALEILKGSAYHK